MQRDIDIDEHNRSYKLIGGPGEGTFVTLQYEDQQVIEYDSPPKPSAYCAKIRLGTISKVRERSTQWKLDIS